MGKKEKPFMVRFRCADGIHREEVPATPQYDLAALLSAGLRIGAIVSLRGRTFRVIRLDGEYAGTSHRPIVVDRIWLGPVRGGGANDHVIYRIHEIEQELEVVGDPEEEGYASVHEAAKLWEMDERKVRRWLRAGKLLSKRFGKEWLVKVREV